VPVREEASEATEGNSGGWYGPRLKGGGAKMGQHEPLRSGELYSRHLLCHQTYSTTVVVFRFEVLDTRPAIKILWTVNISEEQIYIRF
jgi:hypothetical protein